MDGMNGWNERNLLNSLSSIYAAYIDAGRHARGGLILEGSTKKSMYRFESMNLPSFLSGARYATNTPSLFPNPTKKRRTRIPMYGLAPASNNHPSEIIFGVVIVMKKDVM